MCHGNPKELFGFVNNHIQRETLGPVFSVDDHFPTNGEEIKGPRIQHLIQ